MISLSKHTYELTQSEQIKKLKELNVNNATTSDFIAEHARGAYIVAICKPNSIYTFNITSQITNLEKEYIKNLKMISWMENNA